MSDKSHAHKHHHHHGHKFDPAKLDKLRDPERAIYQNPDKLWEVLSAPPVASPPQGVVDVGTGIGFFAIPFARKIPGGIVYATDIVPEMLEHLGKALQAEGVSNVKPVLSEEVKIPLEDGCADIVFMVNLQHEFDDPEGSLRECLRMLKPNGRIGVIDWKPEETPTGPPVHVRVPADKVEAMLNTVGFGEVTDHPILPYHYFLTALKPG